MDHVSLQREVYRQLVDRCQLLVLALLHTPACTSHDVSNNDNDDDNYSLQLNSMHHCVGSEKTHLEVEADNVLRSVWVDGSQYPRVFLFQLLHRHTRTQHRHILTSAPAFISAEKPRIIGNNNNNDRLTAFDPGQPG